MLHTCRCVVWFASACCANDGKLSPAHTFYQVVLPFLTDETLGQAVAKSDAQRVGEGGTDGGSAASRSGLRTPRRSRSAYYGCVRHTLTYLLRARGVGGGSCKLVSLMLRAQMLQLASHDLSFVRHVSAAERALIHLACRQLAYKAAKVGRRPRDDAQATGALLMTREQLSAVRLSISALQARLRQVPGAEPDASAPPPLILCPADEHLGRPRLATLLGLDGDNGAGLLAPIAGMVGVPAHRCDAPIADGIVDITDGVDVDAQGDATQVAGDADASAHGAASGVADVDVSGLEVIGLYFSAGWCPACQTATPLVASAYKQLQVRGHDVQLP